MSAAVTHQVTRLLVQWANGDKHALNELTPLVYRELRQLAASYLRRERAGHILQPTALVHEAYLRLVDQTHPTWQNRSHFYGVSARLMRQILVDHARARNAAKRKAASKIELEGDIRGRPKQTTDVLVLDDALNRFKEIDERASRIVELRFFGGLTLEETATVLGVSAATVKRDWNVAKAWLSRELRGDQHGKTASLEQD